MGHRIVLRFDLTEKRDRPYCSECKRFIKADPDDEVETIKRELNIK